MAIYRCTTKDIYLLVNCFKSPRRRAIQKTKTNRLDSNEQRTQQKPHDGGRHEPFTVRFLSSLSNKHTHLSKQIRNNAIAIASTPKRAEVRRRSRRWRAFHLQVNCCTSPGADELPWRRDHFGEIDGGEQ
eukprot:scaffold40479_cov54-Cyclotella_meneghiniana.AAC.1